MELALEIDFRSNDDAYETIPVVVPTILPNCGSLMMAAAAVAVEMILPTMTAAAAVMPVAILVAYDFV